MGVLKSVRAQFSYLNCLQQEVEAPLVQARLLNDGFVDSWALNLYHDGSGNSSAPKPTALNQLQENPWGVFK